jgi:hypothetical protein
VAEELLHLIAEMKQREKDRKGPETRCPPDLPAVTYFLQLGPIFQNFQNLPK